LTPPLPCSAADYPKPPFPPLPFSFLFWSPHFHEPVFVLISPSPPSPLLFFCFLHKSRRPPLFPSLFFPTRSRGPRSTIIFPFPFFFSNPIQYKWDKFACFLSPTSPFFLLPWAIPGKVSYLLSLGPFFFFPFPPAMTGIGDGPPPLFFFPPPQGAADTSRKFGRPPPPLPPPLLRALFPFFIFLTVIPAIGRDRSLSLGRLIRQSPLLIFYHLFNKAVGEALRYPFFSPPPPLFRRNTGKPLTPFFFPARCFPSSPEKWAQRWSF